MADILVDQQVFTKFLNDDMAKFHDQYRRGIGNILKMLDEDLSVPYIARYRKNQTGGLDAEKIRQIQQTYEKYKKVQNKVNVVIKKIGAEASNDLIESLKHAKSVEEVQELYAPFKKGGKGTLAERARKIGLDTIALDVLKTPEKNVDLLKHVNVQTDGLKTVSEVCTGIQHVIADLIAKDKKIKEKLKEAIEQTNVLLVSKAAGKAKELDKAEKFSLYYNFEAFTQNLHSHQTLAINRAQQQKILSVKLEIRSSSRQWFLNWIKSTWVPRNGTASNIQIITDAVEDSFKRLIEKSFLRRMRAKLTKKAEKDAVDIFSHNLQHLLLVAPVKNKNVLSIDPGFKNGCKIAVLDKNGSILETTVIHPFQKNNEHVAKNTLIDLVKKHGVAVIALGNGTACRQTEDFISDLIKTSDFGPMNLSYSIVSEAGASIYSVTEEAKKEFGDLDPNLISAASIGRRLQDPLLELVKIEAKHIGIGMYQHDVDSNLLKAAVDGVIEDCVSFVGVDLNACSVGMLRRVAGISKKQADAIIEYRHSTGDFINREELCCIKGIGKVTYQNCAGFVRIIPKRNVEEAVEEQVEQERKGKKRKMQSCATAEPPKKKKLKKEKQPKAELMDQTWIHPESYPTAYRVLHYLEATPEMIGTDAIKSLIHKELHTDEKFRALVDGLQTDEETLRLILEGLQQPSDFDLRADFEQPAFKIGLTSINQLEIGQTVTGAVRNNTSFGIFVDIGVDKDGLMHRTNIPNGIQLGPGDRVECKVKSVDVKRQRISLTLTNKLSKDIALS